MTWVDLVVLGVLAVSALFAFMRGLVREVLGLAAWVGAIFAGVWALPRVRPQFQQWLGTSPWIDPVAFAVVFIISLIVLLLSGTLDQCAGAGFADRRSRPDAGAGIRPGQGCGVDHHCLYPWRAGAACRPVAQGRVGGALHSFRLPRSELGGGTHADDEFFPPAAGVSAAAWPPNHRGRVAARDPARPGCGPIDDQGLGEFDGPPFAAR